MLHLKSVVAIGLLSLLLCSNSTDSRSLAAGPYMAPFTQTDLSINKTVKKTTSTSANKMD